MAGYKKQEDYSNYSRPLPELLDGDDWEARNSGKLKVAYVDFKKKEFVVPFTPGPAGELVRAHEAMHVKITPRDCKFKDADFVTYQAIEDARVHQGLRLSGIETDKGRVYYKKELVEIFSDPGKAIPIRFAESVMATYGLAEEDDIRNIVEELRPEVLPICDDIYEKYYASNEREGFLTSVEESYAALKELQKRIKEINTPEEQSMQDSQKGSSSQKSTKNITASFVPGDSDYDTTEELGEITEEEARESEKYAPLRKYGHYPSADGGIPGTMTISKARLDKVIKFKKIKSVKVTASDEGVIPSRMYRYATDMRVFSAKGRRRTNAAVLIDNSGSMSLSDEEIMEIIRQSPASIIAVYSGRSTVGELRIVAEKGRFSDDFVGKNSGGGNIVDYPALLWLAKCKEKKKLWVSDGMVTGKNDRILNGFYIRKITNLCRQHGIERVGDIREVLKSGKLIDSAFDDGYAIGERRKARVGKV